LTHRVSHTLAGRWRQRSQINRSLMAESFRWPLRRRMSAQGSIVRMRQLAHSVSRPSHPASSASSTVRGFSSYDHSLEDAVRTK